MTYLEWGRYVLGQHGHQPPELKLLWEHLRALKQTALAAIQSKGWVGNLDRTNDRNRLYFALGAVEQEWVNTWKRRMEKQYGPVQALVLGDALWIPASLPTSEVAAHLQAAAAELGLMRLQNRSSGLQKERQAIHKSVARDMQAWHHHWPHGTRTRSHPLPPTGKWLPVNAARIRN